MVASLHLGLLLKFALLPALLASDTLPTPPPQRSPTGPCELRWAANLVGGVPVLRRKYTVIHLTRAAATPSHMCRELTPGAFCPLTGPGLQALSRPSGGMRSTEYVRPSQQLDRYPMYGVVLSKSSQQPLRRGESSGIFRPGGAVPRASLPRRPTRASEPASYSLHFPSSRSALAAKDMESEVAYGHRRTISVAAK